MVLKEYAARGTRSDIDWRYHQGVRQSKLCYPLRILQLVKERTLVRQSIFYLAVLMKHHKATVNELNLQ